MIASTLEQIDKCLHFIESLDVTEQKTKVQLQRLDLQSKELTDTVKDINTAFEYYKKSVDVIYQKTVKNLEEQLTSLLQEVFSGCNYGVSFEVEDLRGAKNLIIEFISNNYKGDPRDTGGSLQTVVGYLFHMMYLIQSGRPRILLMDELFRDVNDEYLLNLIELISRLTKSTNSVNVLITHVEELECMASQIYTVRNGDYELTTG
jgi:ABC-type thiamine transport system ATPase subunit